MAHQVQARLSYFKVMHTGSALNFTSHILFLTVLLVFLGYLPPLTSYKSPALTVFLVSTLFAQLLQLFGTLFLTHPIQAAPQNTFTKQF